MGRETICTFLSLRNQSFPVTVGEEGKRCWAPRCTWTNPELGGAITPTLSKALFLQEWPLPDPHRKGGAPLSVADGPSILQPLCTYGTPLRHGKRENHVLENQEASVGNRDRFLYDTDTPTQLLKAPSAFITPLTFKKRELHSEVLFRGLLSNPMNLDSRKHDIAKQFLKWSFSYTIWTLKKKN